MKPESKCQKIVQEIFSCVRFQIIVEVEDALMASGSAVFGG